MNDFSKLRAQPFCVLGLAPPFTWSALVLLVLFGHHLVYGRGVFASDAELRSARFGGSVLSSSGQLSSRFVVFPRAIIRSRYLVSSLHDFLAACSLTHCFREAGLRGFVVRSCLSVRGFDSLISYSGCCRSSGGVVVLSGYI